MRIQLLNARHRKGEIKWYTMGGQEGSDCPQPLRGDLTHRSQNPSVQLAPGLPIPPDYWLYKLQQARHNLWEGSVSECTNPSNWTIEAIIAYWDEYDISYTFTNNGLPEPMLSPYTQVRFPIPNASTSDVFSLPAMDRRHHRTIAIPGGSPKELSSPRHKIRRGRRGMVLQGTRAAKQYFFKKYHRNPKLKSPARCNDLRFQEEIAWEAKRATFEMRMRLKRAVCIIERLEIGRIWRRSSQLVRLDEDAGGIAEALMMVPDTQKRGRVFGRIFHTIRQARRARARAESKRPEYL